jgi:hypothetical protein
MAQRWEEHVVLAVHDEGGNEELERVIATFVDKVARQPWAQWSPDAAVREACRTPLSVCLTHHKQLADQAKQSFTYTQICQRLEEGETHCYRVCENIPETVALVVACQDATSTVRKPARAEMLKRYYALFDRRACGLTPTKDFGGNESSYLPGLEILFGSGEQGRARGRLANFSGKVALSKAIAGSLRFANADWKKKVGNQSKLSRVLGSASEQPNTLLDSMVRAEDETVEAAQTQVTQEAIKEVVWGELKPEEKLFLLWIVSENQNQYMIAPFLPPERSGRDGPVCNGSVTRWKQKFYKRLLALVETAVRRHAAEAGVVITRFPQLDTAGAELIVKRCAAEFTDKSAQTSGKPRVAPEES